MWWQSKQCGGQVKNVEAKQEKYVVAISLKSNIQYLTENSVDDQQGSLFNIVDTSGQ